jgi:Fe-S-cluster-containing hydrogenase component 2
VKNCPDELIHLEDGRAVIAPERCEDCNICSYVCPHGVITGRTMPEFVYVQARAMAAQKGGAAKC